MRSPIAGSMLDRCGTTAAARSECVAMLLAVAVVLHARSAAAEYAHCTTPPALITDSCTIAPHTDGCCRRFCFGPGCSYAQEAVCAGKLRGDSTFNVLDFMGPGGNTDTADDSGSEDSCPVRTAVCCAAKMLYPQTFAPGEAVPARRRATVVFPPGRYITKNVFVLPGMTLSGYGAVVELAPMVPITASMTLFGNESATVQWGFLGLGPGSTSRPPMLVAQDLEPSAILGFVLDGKLADITADEARLDGIMLVSRGGLPADIRRPFRIEDVSLRNINGDGIHVRSNSEFTVVNLESYRSARHHLSFSGDNNWVTVDSWSGTGDVSSTSGVVDYEPNETAARNYVRITDTFLDNGISATRVRSLSEVAVERVLVERPAIVGSGKSFNVGIDGPGTMWSADSVYRGPEHVAINVNEAHGAGGRFTSYNDTFDLRPSDAAGSVCPDRGCDAMSLNAGGTGPEPGITLLSPHFQADTRGLATPLDTVALWIATARTNAAAPVLRCDRMTARGITDGAQLRKITALMTDPIFDVTRTGMSVTSSGSLGVAAHSDVRSYGVWAGERTTCAMAYPPAPAAATEAALAQVMRHQRIALPAAVATGPACPIPHRTDGEQQGVVQGSRILRGSGAPVGACFAGDLYVDDAAGFTGATVWLCKATQTWAAASNAQLSR